MTSLSEPLETARHDFRIVIVDGHTLLADSLALTLSSQGYDAHPLALGATRPSPDAVVSDVLRLRPRLVLLELLLSTATDGLDVIGPLARAGVDVVVVTVHQDRRTWGEAVVRGARTVVSKYAPLPQLLTVVRQLHESGGDESCPEHA